MTTLLSLGGLIVLLYRLQPWRKISFSANRPVHEPRVSIIIPCRNEEKNLPSLLSSLRALEYQNIEIIVVDDHSTDRTYEIAQAAGDVRVVRAGEKPPEWAGKNWACLTGAKVAQGEYLLFTDADTIHAPDSLTKAVRFCAEEKADLVSAPPFHLCETSWEKYLGPFQLFAFIVTAYRQRPRLSRLFAIGQYLLFTRESYLQLGGHEAISSSLAEDVDLARMWMQAGRKYSVYPACDLYRVQMYTEVRAFFFGWKRILRLGMARSHLGSVVEIALVLHLLTIGFGRWEWPLFMLFALGVSVVAVAQRQIGNFRFLGAVLSPLNVGVFALLSASAVFDRVLRRDIVWRNRAYPVSRAS